MKYLLLITLLFSTQAQASKSYLLSRIVMHECAYEMDYAKTGLRCEIKNKVMHIYRDKDFAKGSEQKSYQDYIESKLVARYISFSSAGYYYSHHTKKKITARCSKMKNKFDIHCTRQ